MNNQISYTYRIKKCSLPGAGDVRSKQTLEPCTHEGPNHTIQALTVSLPNSNPTKLYPLAELLTHFLMRLVLPALPEAPNY